MARFLLETQATPSISATDANPRTRGDSISDNKSIVNMDTNMMIILAALLCALICALGVNSVLRCVIRYTRSFTPNEEPVDANANANANVNVTKGIKKRALKLIPLDSYSPELKMKATECLICLGEFFQGETVRVLPKCNHGFHVKCIDTWLLSHSSCPTCRQSLLECQTPANGSRRDDDVAT